MLKLILKPAIYCQLKKKKLFQSNLLSDSVFLENVYNFKFGVFI